MEFIVGPESEGYKAFIRRKGKSKMAPISLNTASRVNPTMRKGRTRSQRSGKRMSASRAMGQHMMSRMNQRMRAMNVLMLKTFGRVRTKGRPIS